MDGQGQQAQVIEPETVVRMAQQAGHQRGDLGGRCRTVSMKFRAEYTFDLHGLVVESERLRWCWTRIKMEQVESLESLEVSVETHQPLTLHKSCGRQMGIGAEPGGPFTPAYQLFEDLPAVCRLLLPVGPPPLMVDMTRPGQGQP
jgi:hypothetical protein